MYVCMHHPRMYVCMYASYVKSMYAYHIYIYMHRYRYACMYLHTYIRGRTADLSPLLDMYSK